MRHGFLCVGKPHTSVLVVCLSIYQ